MSCKSLKKEQVKPFKYTGPAPSPRKRNANKSNFDLLRQFEGACFNIANYPGNKTHAKNFAKLEKELALVLGLTEEEIKKLNS